MGITPQRRAHLPVLSFILLVTSVALRMDASDEGAWKVEVQPEKLVNGAPYLLQVTPPRKLQALSGSWEEKKVYFDFDPRTGTWYGLLGVSLITKPGEYPLVLSGRASDGAPISFERKLQVGSETYPTEALKVSPKFTKPSARDLKRIEKEVALKKELFAHVDPRREWSGSFVAPVTTAVSEGYGTARTFNGELQRRHEGLDYHAPPGTPVAASNSGTVLLARNLFYEGNCVILDHGQGLLTFYMHLSSFRVKEGQRVSSGQVLGQSGATGRATGPHLHMGVRWEGMSLDPAKLLQLNLP